MKLILRYLKRYKGLFILNVCSVFGFALVELGIPTIISDMIDNGVMYGNTDYLLKMGLLITVISIIRCRRNNFTRLLLCKDIHLRNKRYP